MRIIAGDKARMNLLAPKDLTTRPITDRVKESLFAILQPNLSGAQIVDLFCGTGSLGLEALSRGADHAVMVDNDRDAIFRLRKNIAKLQFEDRATVLRTDVFKYYITQSKKPDHSGQKVEPASPFLVFVDRPYRKSQETTVDSPLGKLLIKLSLQTPDQTIVVLRHDRRTHFLDIYNSLKQYDRREYGQMAITFLTK